MDFELSDDEAALAEGIRNLCAGRFPLERLRAAEDGDGRLDGEGWAELAEAGVFSLQVPEADGGVGLGMAAAAVVFEELGRALVPGPLLASHLAAGIIDGAAEGKVVVGAVRRPRSSGTDALVPALVPHLPSLGLLVVVGEEGLTAVDPAELEAVALARSLDPLTPLWRVDHLPEGRPIGGAEEAADWRRAQWVLGGAMLVGLAAGTLDMAVAYAKEREQFGKPIGSFQAVKHLCADMLVASERPVPPFTPPPSPSNSPASVIPTGPPPAPGSWPPRRPSRTARPPSRSTAAWDSPGRSRPTSTPCAPGSWPRPSVRSTIWPSSWPRSTRTSSASSARRTSVQTVSIIPEGRVVYGIQLPIQSQSTIYCEGWEPSSGPAELARVARQADDAGFFYSPSATTPSSPAGWPRP